MCLVYENKFFIKLLINKEGDNFIMPKALDLTGQVFGNLKVIKKVPSRKKKTYWLCECQLCGTLKEIQTCHLTCGVTTSCGKHGSFSLDKNSSLSKCPICEKEFYSNNPNRKYCFECSPLGLSSAERLKLLDRKLKHFLVMYKGGKCERCGYNKCEGALQFHHLNPNEKDFSIANINFGKYFDKEKLLKEVDKCVLLCANCHAEEHYLKE